MFGGTVAVLQVPGPDFQLRWRVAAAIGFRT